MRRFNLELMDYSCIASGKVRRAVVRITDHSVYPAAFRPSPLQSSADQPLTQTITDNVMVTMHGDDDAHFLHPPHLHDIPHHTTVTRLISSILQTCHHVTSIQRQVSTTDFRATESPILPSLR